jgi:hypothetical protein
MIKLPGASLASAVLPCPPPFDIPPGDPAQPGDLALK